MLSIAANVICYQTRGWQFCLSARQRICALGAWYNRTPAAWNTWFHYSRAMAPNITDLNWTPLITRFGESCSNVCVRYADPQCRRTQAATVWRLEWSAAQCCRRCCQRVEKASVGGCSRKRRTLRTSAVGCFDNGMKLLIDSLCTMCFEVFNKIIAWHWAIRWNFCVCLFCKVVQKHCLRDEGK